RIDAVGQELVGQSLVEVQAGGVDRARALRLHPRPGDGEAVGGQAEVRHQLDVVPVAPIVVDGHIGGVAVEDSAGLADELIPNRLAPSVYIDGALDLVGRGGGSPDEPGREDQILGLRLSLLRGHALTAPSMRPPTICRPNTMKTMSRGSTDSAVPVKIDRKSTRLNSSHVKISYAVFCLQKK